jgi:hypothetical protein
LLFINASVRLSAADHFMTPRRFEMGDATTIVDTYLATWNETDPKRRSQLIERVWADGGRYVDPMLEAQDHAALGEMVAGVQAKFPGHRFRRQSGVDTHHDQLRFAWDLVTPDGAVRGRYRHRRPRGRWPAGAHHRLLRRSSSDGRGVSARRPPAIETSMETVAAKGLAATVT